MAVVLIYLDRVEYDKIKRKAYRKHMSIESYIEQLIKKDIGNDENEALAN